MILHFSPLNHDSQKSMELAIQSLRFPMIVCVVYIHSVVYGIGDDAYLYHGVSFLLTGQLAQIAVPLFYFISGYLLFYHKGEHFNVTTYISVLKRRAKSLLVPYLFWNLAVTLLFWGVQSLCPQLITGNNQYQKPVADYGVLDWVYSFWDTNLINGSNGNPFPACFQLWFIRDLMVMVLCSPLIYIFIRKLRCMSLYIAVLVVAWFLDVWPQIAGFNILACLFFPLGAWFSLNRIDFSVTFRRLGLLAFLMYLFGIMVVMLVDDARDYVSRPMIFLGMVWVVAIVSFRVSLISKPLINASLTDSSFLIYAIHGIPVLYLNKILGNILAPLTDVEAVGIYLIGPIFVILFGVVLYKYLNRFFPKFTSVIVGDRSVAKVYTHD